MRLRQLVAGALGAVLELLADDVVAELDALVADEDGRAGDELADLVLALAAEGAVEELAVVVAAAGIFASSNGPHVQALSHAGALRMESIARRRACEAKHRRTAKSL